MRGTRGVGYPAVMHGVVELGQDGRRIVVTGYANWTPLAISLWCVRFGFAELLIGIFVVMYFVQVRRFRGVAAAAAGRAEDWGGGHEPGQGPS